MLLWSCALMFATGLGLAFFSLFVPLLLVAYDLLLLWQFRSTRPPVIEA